MAAPEDFSNPFWTPTRQEAPQEGPEGGAKKQYSSIQPIYGIAMDIGGLGTISARSKTMTLLEFIVNPESPGSQPTLKLTITPSSCVLQMRDKYSESFKDVPHVVYPKQPPAARLNTLSKKDPTVYWISVDRSNKRFRYGQHLTNFSLTYLDVGLNGDKPFPNWMDTLTSTDVFQDGDSVPTGDLAYDPLPVTMDKPPLVVTDQEISLEDLEKYTRTTFANLPPGCQTLYHNVAGHNITLESPDFPDLGDAIDASCKNQKLVCGDMLKKKADANEFGDKNETYLRITIGNNLGNSPGIPYVMEIWPPGHSSPIHDHGKASAVIKVLYGSIQCSWYDAVQDHRKPIQVGNSVILKKGDVTWLGQKQYQIHKLENPGQTVCITLQCYQFEQSDKVHYEYFDYLDPDNNKKPFTPTSDMAYGELVAQLREEWKGKHA
ncbi:cysteine dioxygenase [Aspergillus candidus]|uniref:cysteine dioxygenase n=1 Tax=Aspergillus candidus TaxID=41067 RepID=A0A2I2F3M9_ASPCN|nr:RmlC-like cupin domain-containing protein [Aspergillus candidus]PLB35239.1 RmlC-like cupin domain-containing protein [Aspergillus candidus]